MARIPMTDEQKKAFGAKMKALREAKQKMGIPQNSPGTVPPKSASVEEDPRIVAKMAELDEALRKVNETNARIEAQEKIRSEAFDSGKAISVAEQQSIIESHKTKAQKMKEILQKQPKVRVFMPLEGKEKPGTLFPVTINGYRVNVPKGIYVEVPQQIGDMIMNSMNQTAEAENDPMRIDVDSKKAEILA